MDALETSLGLAVISTLQARLPSHGRRLSGEGNVRDESLGLSDHLRSASSQTQGELGCRLLERDLAGGLANSDVGGF